MLHLAEGGDNGLYRWFFDEIIARNVEFDVIGLSYYPYWHGTIEELQFNMNDISERYDKEVVIAETAYAHTLENGDDLENIFGPEQEEAGGYPATVKGQADLVREVMDAVRKVPNGKGLGIFYWEPAWIPVDGAGWKSGEGNGWDNQAMFDFNGNALKSLNVFRAKRPIMQSH
jgi:arabinogalactan endo-1,4-beta-galactosidase